MKFLCVPCDSPMKLQTVGPPEGGSLSVVFSCPECGYEMAMLTNAYETQIVQSLGVRIGPEIGAEASGTSGSGCPFSAMIPATEEARPFDQAHPSTSLGMTLSPSPFGVAQGDPELAEGSKGQGRPAQAVEPIPIRWTAGAEARLANIPAFVRPMAKTGIERFARERGALEVDEKILDAARDFFGM
jgi:hypothetical protein